MPTPSAGRPRPPQSLEGTLEGQTAPEQKTTSDLSRFDLGSVDPFFVNAAENLPQPDLVDVPNQPGFVKKLLSVLGGTLTENPNATSQMMQLQQGRIDEAEGENRRLEQQFEETQLKLLLAGRKEMTRKLELEGKNQAAALENDRANKLKTGTSEAALMNARTNRMRLEFQVKQVLAGVETDLVNELDHLGNEMDELNLRRNAQHETGEPVEPFLVNSLPDNNGNIKSFHSPEAVEEAIQSAIDGASSLAIEDEDQLAIKEHLMDQVNLFLETPFKNHEASVKAILRRTEEQEADARRKTALKIRTREGGAVSEKAGKATVTEPTKPKAKNAAGLTATRRQ